ncbi:MAG: TlpA family protein disulfide reductase [Acidobacteria bacterium]|nr:TlpA family protein disulfide reductase [Acidobacteriota bacterium]
MILALSHPSMGGSSPPDRFAPGFNLPGRDGKVSLDALKGRLVYVDFWASWCAPCQASFPWLQSIHNRYASKGLTIVAINLDKFRDAADEFLRRHPAPFLVAFDPAGSTAAAYDVGAMPSSYLIDPIGRIVHVQPGFDARKTEEIEKLIEEALPR